MNDTASATRMSTSKANKTQLDIISLIWIVLRLQIDLTIDFESFECEGYIYEIFRLAVRRSTMAHQCGRRTHEVTAILTTHFDKKNKNILRTLEII